MSKIILIYSIIILLPILTFSQSYSKLMKQGEKQLKAENYTLSYATFSKARNKPVITEQENQEASYWCAYSYFMSHDSIDQGFLGALIYTASKSNIIDVAKFYTFTYPFNNESINHNIRYANYGKKNYAEACFYKANICAQSSNKELRTLTFSFLNEALSNGYVIPDEYLNNKISELDIKEYLKVLTNYKVDLVSLLIKEYVVKKINIWQQKGKFEKTIDYKKRVTELSRELKIKEFTQQYIDSAGASKFNLTKARNEYDADNETFKLIFNNSKVLYIPVPISEAPNFDSNFKNLVYENPKFTIWQNHFELLHVEIRNPENNKIYIYDSNDKLAFNANKLALNFDKITIDLNKQKARNNAMEGSNVIQIGKSDVDLNIPKQEKQNLNKFALIIGNENYRTYQTGLKVEQNVEFAVQDALTFKEYCTNSLGISNENIIFNTNAGVVQMTQSLNKINTIIKNLKGQAEIIFYYAGHGFPSSKSNEPYLIPVDVNSSSLDMAINISDVIKKLSEYESKSVIMILDACFTGGGRNMGLLASRGIKVVPKKPLLKGNMVLLSASSAEQSALPYREKGHGLFTYFLLKKLQETNGKVNLLDLDEYLNKQVSIKSVMIHALEQNPKTSISKDVTEVWQNWKL